MRRWRFLELYGSLLVLLFCVAPAKCEMIQWGLLDVGMPDRVDAGPAPGHPFAITGAMDFFFALPRQALPLNEVGSIVLPISHVTVRGNQQFAFDNHPSFPMGMIVEDSSSGANTIMPFNGMLRGGVNYSLRSSTVGADFLGGPTIAHLGSNTYSIYLTMGPLTWTQAQADFEGTISAHVQVSPTNPVATPEPSALALAGIGLVAVAGVGLRNRRKKSISCPGIASNH
ncbi:MAG TPA: PEP-CTERM sorting domain-containing protein [Gemmataceae bacterium]|nr:PEP-CTERM sorting domain-containing protein [Gemmataceae bacterium]